MAASPVLVDRVRAELRVEVTKIVEELLPEVVSEVLSQRVNGEKTALFGAADARLPGTKTCSRCLETKDASEFESGRKQCRACRRRDERERAARRRAPGSARSETNGTPAVGAPASAPLEA